MTEQEHNKFLRENVLPLRPSKLHKSKLAICSPDFLKPKDKYYTKSFEGEVLEWEYLPCSTSYRKDIAYMVKKKLIYVEKTEEFIIFEHNKSTQTELFNEKM